jgi:hypothetical protein
MEQAFEHTAFTKAMPVTWALQAILAEGLAVRAIQNSEGEFDRNSTIHALAQGVLVLGYFLKKTGQFPIDARIAIVEKSLDAAPDKVFLDKIETILNSVYDLMDECYGEFEVSNELVGSAENPVTRQ